MLPPTLSHRPTHVIFILSTSHHHSTQGFAFKNTLALQFHPEVDDELIVRWLERKKEDLGQIGTRPAQNHIIDHEKYGQEVKEWLKKALSKQWKMHLAS